MLMGLNFIGLMTYIKKLALKEGQYRQLHYCYFENIILIANSLYRSLIRQKASFFSFYFSVDSIQPEYDVCCVFAANLCLRNQLGSQCCITKDSGIVSFYSSANFIVCCCFIRIYSRKLFVNSDDDNLNR